MQMTAHPHNRQRPASLQLKQSAIIICRYTIKKKGTETLFCSHQKSETTNVHSQKAKHC